MNYQTANIKILPNSDKLPFVEYYNSLTNSKYVKKGEFTVRGYLLDQISEITGKKVSTLRRWITGEVTPSYLEQQAIADLLDSDMYILWPNKK